jgi:hypothetical protein
VDTTLPTNRQAISCKWIFQIKYTPLGDVHKYKATFVVGGFSQILGVDYGDIFFPYKIHQLDIKTTFLNDILEEEIYANS